MSSSLSTSSPLGASRTVLVVPCYNEAERLQTAAFASFLERHDDLDLLFVDDGSRDDTAALLTELARERGGRVHLLRLARNCGKGEAVRRGMLEVLGGGVRYAGYWDADLAAPLCAVTEFIELLDRQPQLWAVFGARVRLLGHAVVRSELRYLLGRVFAQLAARLLGLPVYDTQCGAKLFRCGPSTRALFDAPFCSDWAFDVELLARMLAQGDGGPALAERVHELPLRRWSEVGGTRLRATDLARIGVDLWRIRRRYLGGRESMSARSR